MLPTQTYLPGELNFRLTARDRNPVGGGIDHADVTLSLSGVQPFAVTAPDEPATPFTGGTATTVEWDVAGTDAAPFNVPNVRISYSTDGGLTFGYEVLASTANDGSESVTIPNVTTTGGRFKVEAIDNYFFDVSDGNLSVAQDPNAPIPTATPTPEPEPSAAPTVDPVAVPGASPDPGRRPGRRLRPRRRSPSR